MRSYGRRVAAKLLCFSMVFQLGGFQAEAEGVKTAGLCEHHTSHTEECGYRKGHSCEHEHTAECYGDTLICGYEEENTASGSNAAHKHTGQCYEPDCPHDEDDHDDACQYEEASPCTYDCEECLTEKEKEVCDCRKKCTEDEIDDDCTVCVEDISLCKGKKQVFKSAGNALRGLEENEDNFTIGTQSKLVTDKIGKNVLQVISGWNGDRLNGVIKFKDAEDLFRKEEFTVGMYVYNQGTDGRGSSITIGEESNYFSIGLYPAALKYCSAGSEEQAEAIDDQKFVNEWISLSVSYREDETEGSVTVFADGEEILGETGIGFKLSELESMEAYIGGTFADTSFMGLGKYDHIIVTDAAAADGFDNELASASNAARAVEEKADEHDFASDLKGSEDQAAAETVIETWIAKECEDIISSGMAVRPAITEFTAAGEPYRESLEGKAGSISFSFKILNGGAAVSAGEKSEEIGAAGSGGEIPVYDSFSGTADGTGSGTEERSLWLDTEGTHIQAHGGQVQSLNEQEVDCDLDENGEIEDKNVWLWYGEDKTRNGNPIDGVRCYVSTDLYNWTNKGTVLRTHDLLPAELSGDGTGKFAEGGVALDESALEKLKSWAEMEAPDGEVSRKDIDMAGEFLEAYRDPQSNTGYDEENLDLAFWNLYTSYCIVERPKMLYNEKTEQYILFYHQDAPSGSRIKTYVEEILANGSSTNTGSRYSRASMGFAVSDSPFGPFKLVNVQRLNGLEGQGDSEKRGMARDMNVFLDDTDIDRNGIKDAYAIYSSEENAKMYISLLNEDYTGPATEGTEQYIELEDGTEVQAFATRVLPDNSREAPAVFKYNGYYYMITSGTSGWNPNKAIYYRSQHIFGPWEAMGDPCEGGSGTTFRSQSTCVIPLDADSGQFIYMGDRWRTEGNSSALWFSSYVWLPVQITSDHRIELKDVSNWDLSLMDQMGTIKINTQLPDTVDYGFAASLPASINVTTGKKTFDTPVVWEAPKALGKQTISGTLTELDRSVSFQADVILRNILYFVDCGAAGREGRDYFNRIRELSPETMKNQDIPDQAYNAGNVWGYEGNNTKARTSGDLYETLRYVSGGDGRELSYRFDELEAGTYEVRIGFFDPWYQYSKGNRKAEITAEINGEQQGSPVSHTITGAKDMVILPDLALSGEGDLRISIDSVNQGNDTDVMVSYIAVCKKRETPEEIFHTVSFETNGGSAVENQTVKEGGYAEEPDEPGREGCRFAGWYKDSGFNEIWNFKVDVLTEDTTIYAKWEKTEEPEETFYHVIFNTDGGSAIESQTVKMGEKAEKPEDPCKAGYYFAGWYKDTEYRTVWVFENNDITENTVIFAKWIKVRSDSDADGNDSYDAAANQAGAANTVLTVNAPADIMNGSWGLSSGGKWYFEKEDGSRAKNEWGMINGKWYYLDPDNGVMKSGWQLVNEKWYYLDPVNGEMKTGRIMADGKTYDLGMDGSWME
ncbi:InlB B-repeat-containing protein [Lachnospiraceae bacterium 54-53]